MHHELSQQKSRKSSKEAGLLMGDVVEIPNRELRSDTVLAEEPSKWNAFKRLLFFIGLIPRKFTR